MDKDFSTLAADLRGIRDRIVQDTKEAIDALSFETLSALRAASFGPFSLAELAARDHPYANRHGISSTKSGLVNLNPAMTHGSRPFYAITGMINLQTGDFMEGWRSKMGVSGGGYTAVITNPVPYAGFLSTGTSLMIQRPIDDMVFESLIPYYNAVAVAYGNKLFRPVFSND